MKIFCMTVWLKERKHQALYIINIHEREKCKSHTTKKENFGSYAQELKEVAVRPLQDRWENEGGIAIRSVRGLQKTEQPLLKWG